MAGWLKLHRSMSDNPFWTEDKFTRGQAWVDLLMLATFKARHVRIQSKRIDLSAGQLCWSKVQLGKRWGWSRGKVIRFLTELESEQMIVQHSNEVTTVITITKWEEYQIDGTTDGTSGSTTDGTTDGTQTKKGEKDKKERRDEEVKNNYVSSSASSDLNFFKNILCYTNGDEQWFTACREKFTDDFLRHCAANCKESRISKDLSPRPCRSDLSIEIDKQFKLYKTNALRNNPNN